MSSAQARELFSFLTWAEVRMVSFDLRQLEVLLKDERRICIPIENSEQACALLSELQRDCRDQERGV